MNRAKQELRQDIAFLKKQYPIHLLDKWSERVISLLEQTELFQQAHIIACYHALPREVQTADFIERWYKEKTIALPLVRGNDLLLLPYQGKSSVQVGAFGIWEPIVSVDTASIEKEVDLIIVPGVAFDYQLNRLGRGKGFYDRLLSTLHVPKIGICYSFQLRKEIPTDIFDEKMDLLITEQGIIE